MLEANIPSQAQAGADAADKIIQGIKGDAAGQDPGQTPPEHTVESLKTKVDELTQKLSVLQGKYNAEIKALGDDPQVLNTLKAENRKLKRQVEDFSKIISDQQNELAKQSTQQVVEPDQDAAQLSDEDLEYLEGEGFEGKTLEIFRKLVSKVADNISQKRYGDISATVNEVKKTTAMSRKDKFEEKLTELVPDWQAINAMTADEDSDWYQFLMTKAPFQARTYNDVLIAAADNFDYNGCAEVFNEYLRLHPSKKKADPPKLKPEDLVEPGQSVSSQLPDDKPTYTMAQYKGHYDALTRGDWKGREDKWQEHANVLDRALQEGRVK